MLDHRAQEAGAFGIPSRPALYMVRGSPNVDVKGAFGNRPQRRPCRERHNRRKPKRDRPLALCQRRSVTVADCGGFGRETWPDAEHALIFIGRVCKREIGVSPDVKLTNFLSTSVDESKNHSPVAGDADFTRMASGNSAARLRAFLLKSTRIIACGCPQGIALVT